MSVTTSIVTFHKNGNADEQGEIRMKKGKRQVLAFAFSLIVILTDVSLMELRVSANELEQEMVCGESGEEDADTLSGNDAGQDELEEDGCDTEEKEGLEEETGESGVEDSGIDEELPSEDTDDSMQEEENAVVLEESASVSGNEMEQLAFSEEKSGGNIASGQYKNEEDGSDITWVIDADGKLTVEGIGNFSDITHNAPWYDYRTDIISAYINVKGMTHASNMFSECSNLERIDLNNFDTANIQYMAFMFYECSSLRELNLKKFNTEKVKTMYKMFAGCSSITSLDLSSFNTSNVTDMSGMFSGCTNLTNLNLSSFNTSKVEDMYGMFWDCNNLLSLDLHHFNTQAVTDMSGMFYGCNSLNNLNVDNFDTSNVARMNGTFRGCNNLVTLNLNSFKTDSVTDMTDMFWECSNLRNLNMENFNTQNVTSMLSMFSGCNSLKNLNLKGFNTERVKNMAGMFSGCSSLENLDVSNFNTGSAQFMAGMFSGCSSLVSLDLSNFDTINIKAGIGGMFKGCSSLEYLDLTSFNTSNITSMQQLFEDCSSLTNIDLSTFETGNVENMSYMFWNCRSLTSLDLSTFNTNHVTDMQVMFSGCGSLKNLNLSNFDTSNVTQMYGMFSDCKNIVELDLSNFDASKVKNMYTSFYNCISLKTIHTPRNLNCTAELPNYVGWSVSTEDIWYQPDGTEITELPKNLAYSIIITAKKIPSIDESEKIESIKLDKNTLTLSVGETAMLKAEIIPANATASITWACNSSIAKVKNGLVTALSKGECTITASAGGKSADCDVTVTAKDVYISGIKIANKVYDGSPNSYTGTAVVLDTSGNQIEGVSLTHTYLGTLSDGSVYAETEEAPSQAGSYTLTFKISGDGAAGYHLNRAAYSFDIIRKAVTITAESVKLEAGERLPETTDLSYTIDGLIENDALPQNPLLKYSVDHITTEREGKYEIIPYGADEGNNYRIKYVNGILLVGNYGEIPVEDIPNGGIIPEGLWVAGIAEDGYDYTGKAVKPQVRVYDYKTPLREKQDYTIAYVRNTKAYSYASTDKEFDVKKAPTITVMAKGNYNGKETVSFKIRPLDIGGEGFSADNMAVAYRKNGVQKPIPELNWNGKKLRNKVDYTVAYYDSKDNELDAIKEVGEYDIVLTGRGNFSGDLGIHLTVTERLKLMNKVSVAGIKGQPYTGDAIMPVLTVKDGRTKLTEDVHYVVSYRNNTEVGTAYAIVTGIEEAGYCGTKRVSFKITGTPIRNASVTGLAGQKFVYEGVDLTPQLQLGIRSNKDGVVKPLVMGTDYMVTWQKNQNAGTATVTFTGKGAYTGTLKKTFKIGKFDIAANADIRFVAALEQETIPYAKGGAKPKVSVKFKNSDGSWQTLTEGQDYTLSYRNHTAVNDGSRADKQPTVIVKGKGNFSGTYGAALNYRINPQELGQLSITAQDKTYQNRKNIYATKVTVTDLNGKILRAGTDYDKAFIYTYEGETVVTDTADDIAITRAAGEVVGKNDMIPAGTKLNVRIEAKAGSNYTGSLVGEYRIAQATISNASVSVLKQTYTGQPIILDKNQITVRIKGTAVEEDQYEIVQSSYKNNVKKGNASVTIRGVGNYGGTRNIKFAIKAKGFVWWK